MNALLFSDGSGRKVRAVLGGPFQTNILLEPLDLKGGEEGRDFIDLCYIRSKINGGHLSEDVASQVAQLFCDAFNARMK